MGGPLILVLLSGRVSVSNNGIQIIQILLFGRFGKFEYKYSFRK